MSDNADYPNPPRRSLANDYVRYEALRMACDTLDPGASTSEILTRAVQLLTFVAPDLVVEHQVTTQGVGTVAERMAYLFRTEAQGRA